MKKKFQVLILKYLCKIFKTKTIDLKQNFLAVFQLFAQIIIFGMLKNITLNWKK